ncbi:hypothetical protein [Micropruina sp.]|uniref:hypothetical protein n=1 Tax=Micropruina sp. TaxID=2737536 RepID=UPI0039E41989
MDLLARYRAGDRERVWHELRQLGDRVREPELARQAQAVCDEMALRARHNIEVVVDRLTTHGYRFHDNDDEQTPIAPILTPTTHAAPLADWLTGRFGSVPITVSSWLRLVGDVWLVGTHPSWPGSAQADPLVLELEYSRYHDASAQDLYDGELDAWHDSTGDDPSAGCFVLPVAPDRLHKANISGGAPYGLRVPDGCAEGIFVAEVAMPFVDYLNQVFRSGGFPGPVQDEAGWCIRRELAEGLLPL